MNKIIVVISAYLMFGCPYLSNAQDGSTMPVSATNAKMGDVYSSGDIIWANKPATEWAEGYPVGNGRLGGMVLGGVQHERISVNHDLLWRQFWSYQEHKLTFY